MCLSKGVLGANTITLSPAAGTMIALPTQTIIGLPLDFDRGADMCVIIISSTHGVSIKSMSPLRFGQTDFRTDPRPVLQVAMHAPDQP